MKRSHDPIFWSLFGAGGMLSALIGPALVFVTGIGVPLALLLSPNLMEYELMLAFTQHWLGKIIVLMVIALFLWHAALRIFHMLHGFGVHTGAMAKLACFGVPLLCTLAAAYYLWILGF